ncbi:MAG: 2-C-methyl-D-erythritol 2,4-cyclodiphosphate synthase [Xanthomonadales bacterium]|nr:2-C-methyl-D-erythritol 2,4-cyclodiphosphate synthase [Gammaproteobacteria bacterium]NND57315.1 2-C-methyl-D-erythritol 2,4-cyclodiphosphate synthase [Xanthomonadales bacterium]NNK51049.1 2-C-methyl-D-erythritol 2,4-cyclodiphosphate synthase [Xanthomonadales bacterium]
MLDFRIGQGFDVHAFAEGDHVMLGGVRVPHSRGLAAHSDGDVALHALCDALLGAVAKGDIGQHFPPGDDQWRDADSRHLLAGVRGILSRDGWRIVNVDLTIVCERPRIAVHVPAMREATAEVLDLPLDAVSVKATTTEKLGFCGRGEGIAALAVALVTRD